jgi:hypothetical protein
VIALPVELRRLDGDDRAEAAVRRGRVLEVMGEDARAIATLEPVVEAHPVTARAAWELPVHDATLAKLREHAPHL